MPSTADCAVIVPCFNEGGTIAELVRALKKDFKVVVVVDDGSTDDTSIQAREAGATVLTQSARSGKGAALLAGWQYAWKNGFSWALCLDGDGQHHPADAPAFLKKAEESGAPLVVGNRMDQAAKIPPLRRWVNRWMSLRISRRAGVNLPDTQCGYRLLNLEVWSRFDWAALHFEIESELIFRLAEAGHPISFVPIQVIYRGEKSKINPLFDTLRWFRWFQQCGQKKRHQFAAGWSWSPSQSRRK